MVTKGGRGKEILILDSSDGNHIKRSGYGILSDYIPHSHLIISKRDSAKNFFRRILDAGLSRVALSRWYRISSFILEYRALTYLRNNRIDIVHVLWGDRDIGFLDLFRKKKRYKLVCSIHNTASILPNVFNFPSRLKYIDSFILMSKSQEKFLLENGVAPNKINVVLHGIDVNFFIPNEYLVKKEFIVISVGSWQRDFSLLRHVCIGLRQEAAINVKIISSKEYEHLFSDLSNVDFVSGLTDEELLFSYQSASCFLMTAIDSTANNAVLEALACGLPVVTEDVGGITEYVNDKCAIICNPKDTTAIVNGILLLYKNDSLTKQMSQSSRLRAEELKWENCVSGIEAIYNDIN